MKRKALLIVFALGMALILLALTWTQTTWAGDRPAPAVAPHAPEDISSGLIGHWSFDDGADPTGDDSGHGHVGDLIGDPTFTTTVPAASGGGTALVFDGDGDYVEVQGDESDFDLQELTVAFWIKTSGFDKYDGLVTKGDSSWRVHEDDGTGYVGFYANGVGGLRSTQFITDDTWHHFAATYYSSTMAIYIDGELDISGARSGIIPDTTYSVTIGTNGQHLHRTFNGLMDDVRIYDYALSADDVFRLYNDTLYRCFAETTGDDVIDFASFDASAVQAAIDALAPTSDTIKLAGTCAGVQGNGTYTQTAYVDQDLTLQGGYTYTGWLDDPDPDTYPTVLDAQSQGRVVKVLNSVTATLDGMTLTGGAASQGGGPAFGSGVHNSGNVILTTSVITGNDNGTDWGGGIYNVGTVVVSDTTFANNAGEGAALFNSKNGTLEIASSAIYNNGPVRFGTIQNRGLLTVTNSTISGNAGAAIDNYHNGGTVTVVHTTIVSNTGYGIENRDSNGAGVSNLTATVLAYNGANDCRNDAGAVFNDLGYNLVQDNTCITATTSFDGDPLLDTLADNGGPTLTHLPLPFSPVIDAVPAVSCTLTTDQRGTPRPVDADCDIGAVELDADLYVPTVVDDAYETSAYVPLIVDPPGVLANDADGDHDVLTATLVTGPGNGTVTLAEDGGFVYTPIAGFAGTDTFTYLADDGDDKALPNAATVTITVTPVTTATLTGTVTDSATGLPLEGATVEAVYNALATFVDTTGADGIYGWIVPTFTYTVTAGMDYGYYPATITDVVVTAPTTTLDIPLDPMPTYVVSGTVTDANTGWPLYAQVDVTGYPGDPVWTDPVTGFYSVTLASEITYTFDVAAWVDGYVDESREVAPLTGDATEDFALSADTATCVAPGYTLDAIFYDDFESGDLLAGGWVMTATNEGRVRVDTYDPFGGDYSVLLDNSVVGSNSLAGIILPIDLLSEPQVYLDFWWHEYSDENHAKDGVFLSDDGGATWCRVFSFNNGFATYTHTEIDLTAEAGSCSMSLGADTQILFQFYDNFPIGADGYTIDQVRLSADSSVTCLLPTNSGLVVGHVTDADTSDPLSGATVENEWGDTATSAATPDDPDIDDGFYVIAAPAGSATLTATLDSYGPDVDLVTVPLSGTVSHDFVLPAGWLEATHDVFSVTLDLGETTMLPLTLTNSGTFTAGFEMVEVNRGFDLAELERGTMAYDPDDALWLLEDPVTGTLAAPGSHVIDVTFDAGEVSQPGTYYATLKVNEDTPYDVPSIPVTMTVNTPSGWGKVEGTLSGLDSCNVDPATLVGYDVLIEDSTGAVYTATTDSKGDYEWWFDASTSPLTITATVVGYETQVVTGVVVTEGEVTTVDVDLRLLEPCVSAAPISFERVIYPGDTVTDTLDLFNAGALSTTFELAETLSWLATDPVSGTLDADGAQAIDLLFGSGITQTGWYSGDLTLLTDDPTNGVIAIPVDLWVVSGTTGIEMSGDSLIVAAPGDVVTHTFVLTNTGDVIDIFDLTLSGHTWPTSVPADTGFLAPGEIFTVSAVVAVPSDPRAVTALIGSDAFTLTAASQVDGTSATVTGATQATAASGVALGGDQAGSGLVGHAVPYTVPVANNGEFTDTIGLATGGNAWPVDLSETSVSLGAGEVGTVVITVTIPSGVALGSSDSVTITAISGLDPVDSDSATLTTTIKLFDIYLPLVVQNATSPAIRSYTR